MDLKELHDAGTQRHPWETARLNAVQRILDPWAFEGVKILDVGCGDGFVARGLFGHLKQKEITAIDISLTDGLIQELEKLPGSVSYSRHLPDNRGFDLLLLLDVLEHIEDDREFLASLVVSHISTGGKVLITVPAFQSLFSCHDTFLGHYRRYRLSSLVDTATACGLKVISSGYLFSSLLLPKLVLFKLLKSANSSVDGVGRWRWGKVVTNFCEKILTMDNNLLMASGRLGLKLPGLTGWVLCEKPE